MYLCIFNFIKIIVFFKSTQKTMFINMIKGHNVLTRFNFSKLNADENSAIGVIMLICLKCSRTAVRSALFTIIKPRLFICVGYIFISLLLNLRVEAADGQFILTSLKMNSEIFIKQSGTNIFHGKNTQIEVIPDFFGAQIDLSNFIFTNDMSVAFLKDGKKTTLESKVTTLEEPMIFDHLPKYSSEMDLRAYRDKLNQEVRLWESIGYHWVFDDIELHFSYQFLISFGELGIQNSTEDHVSIPYILYGNKTQKPFIFLIEQAKLEHQASSQPLESIFCDDCGYFRRSVKVKWELNEKGKWFLQENNLPILDSYEEIIRDIPLPWQLLENDDNPFLGKNWLVKSNGIQGTPYIFLNEGKKAFLTIMDTVEFVELTEEGEVLRETQPILAKVIKPSEYSLNLSNSPVGFYRFNPSAFYRCVSRDIKDQDVTELWYECFNDSEHTVTFTSGAGEGAFSVLDLAECIWDNTHCRFWTDMLESWQNETQQSPFYFHLRETPLLTIKFTLGNLKQAEQENVSQILAQLGSSFLGKIHFQGDILRIKGPLAKNLLEQEDVREIYVDDLDCRLLTCELCKIPENMRIESIDGDVFPHGLQNIKNLRMFDMMHTLNFIKTIKLNNVDFTLGEDFWKEISKHQIIHEIWLDRLTLTRKEMAEDRWDKIPFLLKGLKTLKIQDIPYESEDALSIAYRVCHILEENKAYLENLNLQGNQCFYFHRSARFINLIKKLTMLKKVNMIDSYLSNNDTVYFSKALTELPLLKTVTMTMPCSSLFPFLDSIQYGVRAKSISYALLLPTVPLFEIVAQIFCAETDQFFDTMKNLSRIPSIRSLTLQLNGIRPNLESYGYKAWAREKIWYARTMYLQNPNWDPHIVNYPENPDISDAAKTLEIEFV